MTSRPELVLSPIGSIRTPFKAKYDAPHQPGGHGEYVTGLITLLPNQNFEQALDDLLGMEKIWLLYWFDRNANWKPKVLVPRGERKKRGVFATRSPHRPNPIGLTLVDLLEVQGLTLKVGNIDLLDNTPILDIKPYLPYLEAHPTARAGWIDEAHDSHISPEFTVQWQPAARSQAEYLAEHGIELMEHVERILSRDPSPHPYRRIEPFENAYVIAVRAWRVYFSVEDKLVTIEKIGSGYRREEILSRRAEELSDGEVQKHFAEHWKLS